VLRPIPLRHYIAAMASKSISAAAVLEGTRIDPGQLQNPGYLIEFECYHRLVENMLRLTGDQDIGIHVGMSSELSDFGILGHAAASSRSIRHCIEELWTEFGDALGIMTQFTIPPGNATVVATEIIAPLMSASVYRFCVEEALCMLLKMGALLTGADPAIERLQFSYPEPRYSDRYRDLFNCPLVFSSDFTRVTLKQRWLDRPLKTRDDELNQLYRQHLDQVQRQIEESSPIKMRIRSFLMRRGGHFPLLEVVAREFGVSSRTLRRQLQQQGCSYRELVEECRIELARGWLKSSRLTAKEVGHQLGFDDVNAFRRAFKTWTSQTIGEFRDSAGVKLSQFH
jgi:AraC-like DNA-binding protein